MIEMHYTYKLGINGVSLTCLQLVQIAEARRLTITKKRDQIIPHY